jgi:hypothetical protein
MIAMHSIGKEDAIDISTERPRRRETQIAKDESYDNMKIPKIDASHSSSRWSCHRRSLVAFPTGSILAGRVSPFPDGATSKHLHSSFQRLVLSWYYRELAEK